MLHKSLGHELMHRFSDLVLAQRTKFLVEKRLLFIIYIDSVENTLFICSLVPDWSFDSVYLGIQSMRSLIQISFTALLLRQCSVGRCCI